MSLPQAKKSKEAPTTWAGEKVVDSIDNQLLKKTMQHRPPRPHPIARDHRRMGTTHQPPTIEPRISLRHVTCPPPRMMPCCCCWGWKRLVVGPLIYPWPISSSRVNVGAIQKADLHPLYTISPWCGDDWGDPVSIQQALVENGGQVGGLLLHQSGSKRKKLLLDHTPWIQRWWWWGDAGDWRMPMGVERVVPLKSKHSFTTPTSTSGVIAAWQRRAAIWSKEQVRKKDTTTAKSTGEEKELTQEG